MPRDGSGNYSPPSGNPVVPNTIISSSGWANPTLSDIATALTSSIAKDGQTTPTANLPMGNFRHINVANAVARTDYAAAGQVQDNVMQWLISVGGTDTIVASLPVPPLAAYVAGQRFSFVAAGANTTTAVTLNINGLGAKAVTKQGAIPLVPGDIVAGSVVTVTYDGTQFQVSVAARSGTNVVGTARNARMLVATASTTGTFLADEIVLETALGGTSYTLTSFNQAITTSTTGANGMDVGTAPVSGYIAIYAIYNPTTGARALLGFNATSVVAPNIYGGANMPSGYTASTLIGVVPTNASAQMAPFYIDGRIVYISNTAAATVGTYPASYLGFSVASAVPPNARDMGFIFNYNNGSAGVSMGFDVAANTSGIGQVSFVTYYNSANTSTNARVPITTSQIVVVRGNGSGSPTLQIIATSYSF